MQTSAHSVIAVRSEVLKDSGLIFAQTGEPGIRRSTGRGCEFLYKWQDGTRVVHPKALARIQKLAIPPAWSDVWISPDAAGHIQAVGRDRRGRKQYRYHERWREMRDGNKYDRLIAFGRALPRLRKRVEAVLSRRGLPREKVLAAVIRVMEMTLIRIGNEEYARQNKTYGLTTLRNRHATVGATGAIFEFHGKSGKVHHTGFSDRRLARVVKACQDLPGQRLFQYVDEQGARRTIESSDVNAYLRKVLSDDFSAKDFRTWAGTLTAVRSLTLQEPPTSDAHAKRCVNACVKAVASILGNTAAVARSAYIHPAVLSGYLNGSLVIGSPRQGRTFELAVLRHLETSGSAAE